MKKIDKIRKQLEKLEVWAVPAGFVGGPAGSKDPVPVVKISEVMALFVEKD